MNETEVSRNVTDRLSPASVRIGNIVEEPKGFTHKIERVSEDSDRVRFGVAITDERLINAGFEHDGVFEENEAKDWLLVVNHFEICIDKNKRVFIDGTQVPCEHFHNLQNLYFALCGEELEINGL